jgi:predicted ester cyclase
MVDTNTIDRAHDRAQATAASNKVTVRRYFAALDAQDLDAVDVLLASGYRSHIAGNPTALTGEGMRQFAGMFFAAFPDIRHVVRDQVAEGDTVVTPMTVCGTHGGSFQGIAPTGRSVTMEAVHITRLAAGRIAEQWIVFDALGLLQQIGALPAPANTSDGGATPSPRAQ